MQRAFLLVLVSSVQGLLLGSSGSYNATDQKHPIKNIIVMLRQQTVKIDEEGRTEQRTFNKFTAWCKDEDEKLAESIEDDRAVVSKTKNMVTGKDSEKEELDKQIGTLDTEISEQEASITSANSDRADAKALFDQTEKDLNMTLSALDGAIAGLKSSEANATAANDAEVAKSKLSSLLQIPLFLERLSDHDESELEDTLLRVGNDTSFDDWEKKRKFGPSKDMLDTRDYGFKSGNVVELLGQLKADFTGQLKEARKTEAAAVQDHKILTEDLNAALAASNSSKNEKAAVLTEVKAKLAALKGTQDETAERKDDSTKLLKETQTSCRLKTLEWSKRKEYRYGEMEAIKKAIYVLGKAAGVQTEKPENEDATNATKIAGLLATDSWTSVAGNRGRNDPRSVVVRLLREHASTGRADSASLEAIASKVEGESAGDDDETVIRNMLLIFQKQIWGLERDQDRDSKKWMWCDEELTANKKSFNDTTQQLQTINASILEKESSIQEFTQEINAAQDKVADLSASMSKATEVRQENKAENQAAIRDAKTAQTATQKAMEVLVEFYGAASDDSQEAAGEIGTPSDTSLIQGGAAPETWGSSYSGVADPNAKGGVISIMQTVLADFSKMEVETKAQEVADQSEYDKEMAASRKSQAEARTEVELKTEEKNRYATELHELARSLAITDRELASVKNYLSDLGISCDMAAFAQRNETRTAEMADMELAMSTVKAAFGKATNRTSSFLGLN